MPTKTLLQDEGSRVQPPGPCHTLPYPTQISTMHVTGHVCAAGEQHLAELLLQRLLDLFAGPVLLWPLAAARPAEAPDSSAARLCADMPPAGLPGAGTQTVVSYLHTTFRVL